MTGRVRIAIGILLCLLMQAAMPRVLPPAWAHRGAAQAAMTQVPAAMAPTAPMSTSMPMPGCTACPGAVRCGDVPAHAIGHDASCCPACAAGAMLADAGGTVAWPTRLMAGPAYRGVPVAPMAGRGAAPLLRPPKPGIPASRGDATA